MSNLTIPVTKGKGSVTIDTEAVPETYYVEALRQGFKVIVNGGASKITKPAIETEEDMAKYHAAAMAKAEERVLAMLAGELKLGRSAGATTKVAGAVMTEARRLARDLVKAALKKAGLKQSHYSSSEITQAANAMIAENADLITMAEANIAARGKISAPFDPSTLHADPKLVAAAEEKKLAGKAKGVISSKQAGKVAPRASHTTH